jgi:hypothetical protein
MGKEQEPKLLNPLFGNRKRLQTNCSIEHRTDQSFKEMVNINNIMSKYKKTGELPNFKTKTPQYIDETKIPSFLEAHSIVQKAKELFYELPSQVRKALDNNPANLEHALQDKDLQPLFVKHGLLEEKKVVSDSSELQQLKEIALEIKALNKKTDK